ncbi:MAG: hypothetical protein AB7E59_11630 [Pusillimonas sp.]
MKTSAFDRLRALPAIFSISMLAARLDGNKDKASIYAKRWKDAGLIRAAGPRVGVYYNLVVDPQEPVTRSLEALHLLYPKAVIAADTVLHDQGWTTQIPLKTQVIVNDHRTVPVLDGFDLHRRPRKWFREFAEHIDQTTFARLTPYGALADACKYGQYNHQRMWVPDIDDLEADEIDWEQLHQVFDAHDIELPPPYQELACTV